MWCFTHFSTPHTFMELLRPFGRSGLRRSLFRRPAQDAPSLWTGADQKLLGRGIDARGTGKTPRTQHGMVGGTTSEEQVWALGGAAAALQRARVFWAN